MNFWGTNGVEPGDINQGYIGNCWLIAAISALAEHGSRIDRLMVNEGFSDNGIYAANMYLIGVPITLIVDDYLPMVDNNTVFGGLGKDGSLWGAIAEKMFAKYYGNYENLDGGIMGPAVSAMNGSPYK